MVAISTFKLMRSIVGAIKQSFRYYPELKDIDHQIINTIAKVICCQIESTLTGSLCNKILKEKEDIMKSRHDVYEIIKQQEEKIASMSKSNKFFMSVLEKHGIDWHKAENKP